MSRIIAAVLLLLIAHGGHARDIAKQIPDQLAPWVPWVLGDEDRRACPTPTTGGERLCIWPGRLFLDLQTTEGLFAQLWTAHAPSWVPLPGSAKAWPQDVRVGETEAAVVERNGMPSLYLEPGEHALSGRFVWNKIPEGLALPLASAMVDLRILGDPIAFPRFDQDGRLWLAQSGDNEAVEQEDSLSLRVSRRIEDDTPLRLITHLEIDVAGNARELLLGPVLLEGGRVLKISGGLPARIEPDGQLRLQVRPGHWELEVTEFHSNPITTLTRGSIDAPWPDEEIWVFAAHPELRQVELSGAPAVDPRQFRLPADWLRLPAYLVGPDTSLQLNLVGRGDATPAPDRLGLERELWMDFDGGGYTVKDNIAGQLTRSWRLEVEAPLHLGRVEANGEARFITRLGESGRDGVEVRQGQLQMVAESRIDDDERSLPATGWALDFDKVSTLVHLPPGWRVLGVTGVDNLPRTWLNQWTLLDLFLVLLIGIASARLWGPLWGLLALVTTVVTWHESWAPQFIWLNLLAAIALLRLLPESPERALMARLRGLLRWYYRASLLVLAFIAIPFLVDQARTAIYPQLGGMPYANMSSIVAPLPSKPEIADNFSRSPEILSEVVEQSIQPAPPRKKRLPQVDPDAKIQTGPGIPQWSWREVRLSWNGPVPRDHEVGLWLLSPASNLVLFVVRILLVLTFALQIAGLLGRLLKRSPVVTALVLAGVSLSASPPADAQGFPSPELLEELSTRLNEPPDCLPACADIPRMSLSIEGETLELNLTVVVATPAAVPIPGAVGSWTPGTVTLEDQPFDVLRRTAEGGFLLPLPEGRWRVKLSGRLPPRAQVNLPLPLRPRFAEAHSDTYKVEGIDAQGRPGAQLQLVRIESASEDDGLQPLESPPLVRVTRILSLGVDWRVETQVSRLSPPQHPITLEVPLIAGERVLREGAQINESRLLVSLSPGQQATNWSSALEPVDLISLRASEDPRISEEWRVDVGAQWHLESEGIPAIHHQGKLAQWLPTWRPWPGEEVALQISRPQGVEGPTLTLVRSDYRIVPGKRAAEASIELTLRSSQGGRHAIELPEGAQLKRVSIDGTERPLRLDGTKLVVPVVPGTQKVTIEWHQPEPIGITYAPARPNIGIAGVNANLHMQLGHDRWVLFTGGPVLGPAVLFWGYVIVLVLIAIGLARSHVTPLRVWDWLLLGLGLSQAGVVTSVLVVAWLFALGLRTRASDDMSAGRFNLMQVFLVLLSFAALLGLLGAVQQGLLGLPDMQISGNGSDARNLRWYQDRSDAGLPEIWAISVPIVVYRTLMLAWALWLAFRLIKWLRWGWQGLSSPVLWHEVNLQMPKGRAAASAEKGESL